MENPDLHTIKACLKGNREAQHQLYKAYKVYLYGICMRYAKNKNEAEDMLQEGFYRILKDLHQYKGAASLKSWMTRVMINSALMHIRKYRKVHYIEFESERMENVIEADHSMLEKDRAEAIILLIRKLPIAHKTVFNLKAIDGFSYKEIATQLEMNEATVRSHYLRARKKLQELLVNELH